MDECSHDVLGGICTVCGLCIEDYALVDTYTRHTVTETTKWKYAIKDTSQHYDKQLDAVIHALNAETNKLEIRNLLLNKKFELRMSLMDKILCTTYYVLKKNDFPITYADLGIFSCKSLMRLQKNVMVEFEFINTPYFSIFNRVQGNFREISNDKMQENTLAETNVKTKTNYTEYKKLCEEKVYSNPLVLCIAYHLYLNKSKNWYEKYKLEQFGSAQVFRKVIRLIKAYYTKAK